MSANQQLTTSRKQDNVAV